MKHSPTHGLNPSSPRRRSLWVSAAALLSAVGLVGATAAAQTTGEAPPPEGMQTQSPFWGGPSAPGHRDRDHRGGYDRHEGFDDAFPVGLVAEVAPAHANYIAMKWGYRTSRSAVWRRVNELRSDFETSEDYRQLQEQIQLALADLEQARQEALAPLRENPEYVAAGELHRSLEAQIRMMHQEQRDVDPAELTAMSEQAMEYARRQHDMEAAEAGGDDAIADARQRLEELGQRQRELEAQFERSVRDDEQLQQMRADLAQLKVARLASGAYYQSTVQAANLASRFAYTRQYLRSPWYGHAGYINPYPYGYGHGFGYGGYYPRGLIIAGPGLGGVGPTQVKLENPFRPMVGSGVPFVGSGAQVNPAPTIPPEAFRP